MHNYHPIFSKFSLDTVKIILHYSAIVYLNKGQTLYAENFNEQYIYVVLFGRLKLFRPVRDPNSSQNGKDSEWLMQAYGQTLNIGWTIGEEILFRPENQFGHVERRDTCKALQESGVLGIQKPNLNLIKMALNERGEGEEFMKLEIILRGNNLIKNKWH